MLVIASDIHLTDRDEGSPASNDELLDWLDRIERRLGRLNEPVGELHLVLNGDVIDIIRSKEWDDKKFAPWQAVSPQFKDFETTSSNKCVVDAVTSTCKRYAPFFERLRDIQERGGTVTYIAGNHDFMLQLSSGARAELYRQLYGEGVRDSKTRLPTEIHIAEYDVYIEHGHRCDAYNVHDASTGRWAFGDAVVLEFLNRLPRRVLDANANLTSSSPLILELAELDNVEPSYMIPLFISQVVESRLSNADEGDALKQLVRKAATDLLSIEQFKSNQFATYRLLLECLANWKLVELLARTREAFDSSDGADVVRRRCEELINTDAPSVRHIILGHNHLPDVVALNGFGDRGPVYYLNTGTWRRGLKRVDRSARFAGMRASCWVELWNPRGEQGTQFRHVHERVG